MLNGAGQLVLLTRYLRQARQSVKIDFHVGDAAVGEDDSAVSGAGLDADLRETFGTGRALRERPIETIHVGFQLFNRRVLGSDLTDLATNGNRDALWLQLANGQGELDCLLIVRTLLLIEIGLRE